MKPNRETVISDFMASDQLDNPYYNVCASLDITKFHAFVKESNKPFFVSFLFAVANIANEIPAFRYRILDDKIIEHEQVDCAFQLPKDKQIYTAKFINNFYRFVEYTLAEIELCKSEENPDQSIANNILMATSIPVVSFSSITLPRHKELNKGAPYFVWGKIEENSNMKTLPLSIQGHFSLIDGYLIGEYYEKLQRLLDRCDTLKMYETDEEEQKAREYNTKIIRGSDLNQRINSQVPYHK